MKRVNWIVVAIAVVVTAGALTSLAVAGDEDKNDKMAAKKVTVEGVLIDTKCYGMNPDNWMADHMTPKGKMPNCAQACANMGIPVGVLKDGKPGNEVFILITPSSALADHMARTVKVEGMAAYDGAGLIPDKLWYKDDDGKWQEVKIATMM